MAEKADLPFSVSKAAGGGFLVNAIGGPAESGGLISGDLVSALDGKTPVSFEDLEFILDGMRIGDTPRVTIHRAGTEMEFQIRLVNRYTAFYVVVAWFVGTLFFLSGTFVLLRKRDDLAALTYQFGAISVAAVIMMTWGCYAIGPSGLGQTIRIMFSSAYAFVPVLFLHFSLVFPSRKRMLASNLIRFVYIIPVVLSVLMATTFLGATSHFSLQWFHSFMLFFNITRWMYATLVVIAIGFFVSSYISAREEMERRQLRWVILGLTISSLGFVSLWQLPQLLSSHGLVREEFVILLAGATPITFGVAIVRYHAMNIDYIINRGSVYIIVIAILLSVYALVVGTVSAVVSSFTVGRSVLASAVAAVVVAILFERVRRRTQVFVDKNFFRVKYDMRHVETSFTEEVRKCVTVNRVAELLVRVASDAIPVEKIGFFVLDQPATRLHLIAHRNFDLLSVHSVVFEFRKLKSTLSCPVAVDGRVEPGIQYEIADPRVFNRWGMTIVFTMKSERADILGFLVMGQKKSATRYSVEDVELLNFLVQQSGLAYERILLQSRLLLEQEERERLEELNQLKTYFVSSVSHDLKTPLTSIRMFAEMLKSEKGLSSKRARKYLDIVEGESRRLTRLIDNVLTVAKMERSSVAYNFSEVSLNDVVKEALKITEYEALMEGCVIQMKLSKKDGRISADRDSVVEAIGNLLSNAMYYSAGKKMIRVETAMRNGFSRVSVRDNGVGINEDELPHLFEPFYRGRDSSALRPGGTGLGLSVVKNVMDAHRGKIEIESIPKAGTKITLLFPTMGAYEKDSDNRR